MNSVIMWSTAIITVGGAVGILWKLFSPLIKKIRHITNELERFTVDWFGEDEREGRSRVPGVMERLNRIDGELQHNSGSSMKDSQKRIEQTLKKIDERLEEGNKRFVALENRVSELEKDN